MFNFLVDTCVWLDLAKDSKQASILDVVEELIRRGELGLLVPQLIVDEFKRNRERVAKESAKSLSSHFHLVKDAIGRVGGDASEVAAVLKHLDNVRHKIPLVGGEAVARLDRIEALLTKTKPLPLSDSAKLAAAERAVDKRAPFHRNTNAMADSMLVEAYAELVRDRTLSGNRFAFVTHNKNDFSAENANPKLPHADIAACFSKIKSRYFVNLAEALRHVDASLVTETMIEASWTQEPRSLTDILEAEKRLTDHVWYNRHKSREYEIEHGTLTVVEKDPGTREAREKTIIRSVWEGAMRSARKLEKHYGKKTLGPWDDFEWGMINGKLSALRWALGDEWDELYT